MADKKNCSPVSGSVPANAFNPEFLQALQAREDSPLAAIEAETRGPWQVLELPADQGCGGRPDPEAEPSGCQALVKSLNRVLFSQEDDFLAIVSEWQAIERPFPGLLYVHQQRLTIDQVIDEVELIAKASEPEELRNQVVYLPL